MLRPSPKRVEALMSRIMPNGLTPCETSYDEKERIGRRVIRYGGCGGGDDFPNISAPAEAETETPGTVT